jgi:hypothetical protein
LKRIFIIMLVLLFTLIPVIVSAEPETDRERLVRIETKLDIVIEQNKTNEPRINALEQDVGVLWFAIITMGVPLALTTYKALIDVLSKKQVSKC